MNTQKLDRTTDAIAENILAVDRISFNDVSHNDVECIAMWQIKAAMQEAYCMGFQAAEKTFAV